MSRLPSSGDDAWCWIRGEGGDPTPPGPGDQNISPLFIPRSPESQTSVLCRLCRALSQKTINIVSNTNHLLLGAGDADCDRLAPGPGQTLDTDTDPDLSAVTLLTFLWPGRLRGRRLICFCTLLLDAPAWCLPSSELSVLSLLSPLPWCPAWVTGNIVTLSPDSAHSLTAPASPGLSAFSASEAAHRSPPGSWLQHSAHFGNLTHSLVTLMTHSSLRCQRS